MGTSSTGSRLTSVAAPSTSVHRGRVHCLLRCCMECLRDRSLDRYSFYCTQLIYCSSSSATSSTPMHTLTILRSTAFAFRLTPKFFRSESLCFNDVSAWTASNRLQINPAKTEVLWCASTRRQHQLPTRPVRVGSASVLPVSTVRDLGVHLDSDVTLTTHITATVRSCFSALRQIRSVRRSLTRDALVTLLRALVISKLDYCCSVLAGVNGTQLRRLQSVLNAAARLVFSARRSDHVTPLLCEHHWLRVAERIQFQLCTLVYRCLHGTGPAYLADSLHLAADVDSHRRLRSADGLTLLVPATRRSTLGDCAFTVAGARAWSALPSSVRTARSLEAFCRELETLLFGEFFP